MWLHNGACMMCAGSVICAMVQATVQKFLTVVTLSQKCIC